jgi:hypothetical protein
MTKRFKEERHLPSIKNSKLRIWKSSSSNKRWKKSERSFYSSNIT